MQTPSFDQLLEATCHFGHLKRKWNPAMAPYIFMERNGIHIIDLYKTQAELEEAAAALKNIAKSGKKVLFVATKKQAKQVVADRAASVGMPYVIERWARWYAHQLPNYPQGSEEDGRYRQMIKDGTFDNLSKRENFKLPANVLNLKRNLGSIADLNRLPFSNFRC